MHTIQFHDANNTQRNSGVASIGPDRALTFNPPGGAMSGLVQLLELFFTGCFKETHTIILFKLHEIWSVYSQENH